MGALLGLIPAPYRLMAGAVAVLVALAGAAAAGARLSAGHYEPLLAEANRRAGEIEHAYRTLAAGIAEQNATVQALHDAGERRKKNAIAAAETARHDAQAHYRRAEAILGLKPPPGVDPCRSAREAFDAELREERGK